MLEKLASFSSRNPHQYEKTFYELTIAAEFVEQGQHVKFIKPSDKKTPDILVNSNVEIECKSKDSVHPYYRKYEDFWNYILKRVPEWMDRNKVNYLIHLFIQEEIDVYTMQSLKKRIHDIICHKMEGIFELDGNLTIKAKILLPYNLETEKSLTVENFPEIINVLPNLVDIDFLAEPMKIHRKNEKILITNFRSLSMKVPFHPERTIITNIKNAVKQFSGVFPGIVYLDISAINKGMKYMT